MWLLTHLFGEEYTDAKADSFTSGYGDGYRKGMEQAKELYAEKYKTLTELKEAEYAQKQANQPLPLNFQVNLHEVFEVTKDRKLKLGGHILTDEEIANFKVDAATLSRLRLWSILQETLKQKALEKSVLHSTTWEEALAGKMLLHDISLRNSILEVIRDYKLENSGE